MQSWGLLMVQLQLDPAEPSSLSGFPDAVTWFLAVALHRSETALLWEHGGGGNEDWGRKEWGEEGTMTSEPPVSSN